MHKKKFLILIWILILLSITLNTCKESNPANSDNISNKTLKEICRFRVHLGEIVDIYVKGNYAYLADIDNGLRIVDISDKTYPEEKLIYGPNDRTNGIYPKDDYLFITGIQIYGIDIVDISNPLAPVKITNIPAVHDIRDIFFQDTLMFIAALDNGLLVYSINDINNPRFISSFNEQSTCWIRSVDVVNQTAYLGDDYYAFRILDISNIDSLRQISLIPMDNSVYDIEVEGNHAFIAYGSRGFVTYDVSDPLRTNELNVYQPDSIRIYNIHVENDLGYLSDFEDAFHVLDLKDPANPQLIDSFQTDRVIYNSYNIGEYIYLAASYNGMYILQFN
jgi:hypothetical protein